MPNAMKHTNIEIKARCTEPDQIRAILTEQGALFTGTDHQIDTYFKVPKGRLKLREGTIENALIYYERENQEGPKQSNIIFSKTDPAHTPRAVLTQALGVLVTVDKQREIYFIENIKFHIDTVKDLGPFVEIEAIDTDGSIGKDRLWEQCTTYLDLLQIDETDLCATSYSDMLLARY